jgi:ankyrin repeat protein
MAQNQVLFNSVIRNNIDSIREGIEKQKLDVNMRSEETGATALRIAVSRDNVDIIKVLLKYNANPNIVDNCGNTPLQDIVLQFKDKTKKNKEVCLEIATLLLEAGADPDIKNNYGETPFFWVKDGRTSDEKSMKALLEKYRKQPDFTAVPPVAKEDKEIMSTQQRTEQIPLAPPRKNKSWPITQKEANVDENAGDDAPLLSTNRYSFNVSSAQQKSSSVSQSDEKTCIFM